MTEPDQILQELNQMRDRLKEALDVLEAIRSGRVDALLVRRDGEQEERVFIMEGADRPYRVMVELMNEGAATLATDGAILYANTYLAELLGVPLETVLGASFEEFVVPAERERFQAALQEAVQENGKLEVTLQGRQGHTNPVLLSFSPLQNSEPAVCLVITDLSEQQRMTQSLHAEIAERRQAQIDLAEIQRNLMDSIEAERTQLARELHDGPMQDIYAVIYTLALMAETPIEPEVRDKLHQMERTLKTINQTLRTTARNLLPPSLGAFGLEKSIREHVANARLGDQEVEVRLDLQKDGQRMPETVRLALFRIYQIAFTNSLRHAEATQVTIRLFWDARWVTLEVEDNGRGFTVPKRWIDFAREGHLGLVGAQERARRIGGELEVNSQCGQGTLLRVVVPCELGPAED